VVDGDCVHVGYGFAYRSMRPLSLRVELRD